VGVDQVSEIVRAAIPTPASVKDTVPADGLIRGGERQGSVTAAA
jgi:hypothetical protein